jgi:hypothetical protein
MVMAWIEPILIVTGLVTMGAIHLQGGGANALFLLPQPGLSLLLGIKTAEPRALSCWQGIGDYWSFWSGHCWSTVS